jgi:predicted RNA-binding Zn ribbon-like protein
MSTAMTAYDDRWAELAFSLVNTLDPYYDQPESLREPADLARFLQEWGITSDRPLGERDLAQAHALRARLGAVFGAPEAAVAATLNDLLAGARLLPRLGADATGGWRLELAAEPGTSVLERLTIEASLGLAQALERYGAARLRRCAASPCEEAFIDTSRNRSRRYCSQRCANRHNVAAFRRRRRPSDAAR